MGSSVSTFLRREATFEAVEVAGEPCIVIHPDSEYVDALNLYFGTNVGDHDPAVVLRQLRELAAAVNAALNMAAEALPAEPGPDDPTDEPTDEPATEPTEPVPAAEPLPDGVRYHHPADCWPADTASAEAAYREAQSIDRTLRLAAQAPEWPGRRIADQASPKVAGV